MFIKKKHYDMHMYFPIVNVPFLSSTIPIRPACEVYIYAFDSHSRVFYYRAVALLLIYYPTKLTSVQKPYDRHRGLVDTYRISVTGYIPML